MDINTILDRTIEPLQCDIDFWTRQLAEHALFISELLDPNTAGDLKEEAKMLYAGWYNQLKGCTCIKYNPIYSNSQYALLEAIHNRLSLGINVNLPVISRDDFHDLIRHMILEQTFFVRLVQHRMTVRYELQFWIQENAEHTTLVSHLLPPSPLKNQITTLANNLNNNKVITNYNLPYLQSQLELYKASNQGAIIVHNAVHSGQITGVNDAMLEHEMREAKMGEDRLSHLISLLQPTAV